MNNILDSILNAMEGPPVSTISDEQRQRAKVELEKQKKFVMLEKAKLLKFRKNVEVKVVDFLKSDLNFLEFEATNSINRNIIYDVAEIAGLAAYSFGEEDVDRYTVLYRSRDGPCEDEKVIRKFGGKWTEEIRAKLAAERAAKPIWTTNMPGPSGSSKVKFVPKGVFYGDKYKHLSLGQPQRTSNNDMYGEVPSSLKRDHRSIEETMNDIKEKRMSKVAKVTSTTVIGDENNTSDSDDSAL